MHSDGGWKVSTIEVIIMFNVWLNDGRVRSADDGGNVIPGQNLLRGI